MIAETSWCRRAASVAILATATAFVGCARDDGYLPVAGRVQFRGEDLKEGTIQFYYTGEKSAVCAGTSIKAGKYEIPKEHGLKPGTYLVRISATEPVEGRGTGGMNPFLSRESIPARYNTHSTLTVDVRAGERGTFDFNLE